MSLKDRTLCKMLEKMVKKKDSQDLQPWMKELLSTMDQKVCWISERYLEEIICYLNDQPSL